MGTIELKLVAVNRFINFEPYFVDTITEDSYTFSGGNLYGLIGEYGSGNDFLSCYLTEKIDIVDKRKGEDILINNKIVDKNTLNCLVASVGFNTNKFIFSFTRTVRRELLYGLKQSKKNETLDHIVDIFGLTPERLDRKLKHLSWERWRAYLAMGYAHNKKIFCFPYCNSGLIWEFERIGVMKCLDILKKDGAIILLPAPFKKCLSKYTDNFLEVIPPHFTSMEL